MSTGIDTAQEADQDCQEKVYIVYDLIRGIRDPEKSASLEDLAVVCEEDVTVTRFARAAAAEDTYLVRVTFTPTVPACSLATLIGLCVRVRLQQELPFTHKLDILVKEGSHLTRDEVNKQINDKERVAAAMENPSLSETVLRCIQDAD